MRGPASAEQFAAARVLDANLNRCAEGLRVVEESLRLVLADAHLTGVCKSIRHRLAELARELESRMRLSAARDTQHDVGRTTQQASEYQRQDVRQIVEAGFARSAQSLRTLEEYSKLVAATCAVTAEELRFRVYELQKATTALFDSQLRLADIRLCVLVDARESEAAFSELVSELIAGGAGMLQLRDKRLDDSTLLERARKLVELTRGTSVLAIVNDRVDVAVASGADGVHLGQDDLPVSAARRIAPPGLLIGVSTHDIDQARRAVLEGADYLGAGPVFVSRTKSFQRLAGIAFLAEVAAEIALPAFAIGGISGENLEQVQNAGFTRIAVSGAALDPHVSQARENVARLASMLDVGPGEGAEAPPAGRSSPG